MNDTLYLEESAAEVWNITKLSEESKFCSAVFTFIRLTSIPLGLGIIIINYLAFKSISRSHSFSLDSLLQAFETYWEN